MLCEICQKRHARVHETHIYKLEGAATRTTRRHLCEVCAGRKTEQQVEEEAVAQRERSRQRMEQSMARSKLILAELFGPDLEALRSQGVFSYGGAHAFAWKLYLTAMSTRREEVDVMEALFGAAEAGKNHIVRQVLDCEAHVIRWCADPERMMARVFEPFPNAAPRLDMEKHLLFVEGELDLYPNCFRSLTFCSLAAGMISAASIPDPQRVRFQFKPQKQPRLSDGLDSARQPPA